MAYLGGREGVLRLLPAHGRHLLERGRPPGHEADCVRAVRHQLLQDVHGLQGRVHASGQRDVGVLQDLQGDRRHRPGARGERRRHRGQPEAAPVHGDHGAGGTPNVQAGGGNVILPYCF